MRSVSHPNCVVCGRRGKPLYEDLDDRIFSAPGKWTLVSCEDAACGTLWLDPAPHPADLGAAYEGYFTHGIEGTPRLSSLKRAYIQVTHAPYLGATVWDRIRAFLFALRFRRKLEADDQVCHLDIHSPGMKVLDLGCGDGRTLWSLRQFGCDAIGVDFDGEAVATARARGLDVRTGSLEDQDFADATFDAVVLSHVIEHVPDPEGVLREIHRILKPGGQIRMLTPNAAAWGHGHFGRDWMALDPPRHLNIFTPRGLARLMEKAGFARAHAGTTVSGADRIAIMSMNIGENGRARIAEKPARGRKRLGRWFLYREAFLDRGDRGLGSQIVAKGAKSRQA
jgi:2-polyprenyl-3-methyl-5-hydroxy-6-metoxy-1,4-benzoquinol methylase